MKHKKEGRKFGRERNQRRALMRALTVNLIRDGKIKTTEAKAKELRPRVDKMMTKAKKGDLASARLVISKIGEKAGARLLKTIAPKYKERKGGYTRIVKLPPRKGDAARMAIIEFV